MINIHTARLQSSATKTIFSEETSFEDYVDFKINEASAEQEFKAELDYIPELFEFLKVNYQPEGYKIQVFTIFDGCKSVLISWYPINKERL